MSLESSVKEELRPVPKRNTEEPVLTSNFGQNADEEMEIDLVEIAYLLLDKLHFIILWFMVGAVILNAFSYFMIHPTYQSTAKMYIVSSSSDSVVDLTDLNIGTSLTLDYEELIYSDPILEQVIDKLKLDVTTEELKNMISIENPSDTRILNITTTCNSPQEAKDLANTLVDVSLDYLPRTMNTDAPNVAQDAKLADSKFAPSYTKYTMIGAFLGMFLYCAYIIVKHLMDDTIHTAEDMEKYFGLVPLTTVPESDFIKEAMGDDEEKEKMFKKGKGKNGKNNKKQED